jgi:ABC-type arginine transport system ATPase subunit
MSYARIEAAIPASDRQQNHSLDRAYILLSTLKVQNLKKKSPHSYSGIRTQRTYIIKNTDSYGH